jgi:hypothetical protein
MCVIDQVSAERPVLGSGMVNFPRTSTEGIPKVASTGK